VVGEARKGDEEHADGVGGGGGWEGGGGAENEKKERERAFFPLPPQSGLIF
jgi:hypothetical protein